jgi:hypothetical protein
LIVLSAGKKESLKVFQKKKSTEKYLDHRNKKTLNREMENAVKSGTL